MTVDKAALAKLRPGMPLSALAEAFGGEWVPLRAGETCFSSPENGIFARVDLRGIIGSTSFLAKFPPALEIERLHVGMTLEEARAIYPSLRLAGDAEAEAKYHNTPFVTMLPDGNELRVTGRDGKVLSIRLSCPSAVYEPPAPAYPPAEEPAGAPFADPNLKLVVLDELIGKRAIDLGTPKALAKHILGPGYKEERDGYELLKPVYDYLVRYPLTSGHLAAVEDLTFDGGNDIYSYVFPFWDGEGGEFDVSSLAGIAQLPNLRRFSVISMLDDGDLAALAPLARLEAVGLCPGPYRNAGAVLGLPRLQEFQCFEGSLDDPAIVEALKVRGVQVKIYR
jgi:hypothetical protein